MVVEGCQVLAPKTSTVGKWQSSLASRKCDLVDRLAHYDPGSIPTKAAAHVAPFEQTGGGGNSGSFSAVVWIIDTGSSSANPSTVSTAPSGSSA